MLGLRVVMAMPKRSALVPANCADFLGVGANSGRRAAAPLVPGQELGWVLDNPRGPDRPRGQHRRVSTRRTISTTRWLAGRSRLTCSAVPTRWRMAAARSGDRRVLEEPSQCGLRRLVFNGWKTFPKQNAALWLATQSVADPLKIPEIAHTLREQCLTHMHFPNAAGVWENEYGPGGLNLSPRAFEWIRSGLLGGGKGRFLLKQGARHVPLQLSLEGEHLEDVRAELSGRTETINLMDEVIAEMGDGDRDALFREFHARRKSPEFQRRLRRRNSPRRRHETEWRRFRDRPRWPSLLRFFRASPRSGAGARRLGADRGAPAARARNLRGRSREVPQSARKGGRLLRHRAIGTRSIREIDARDRPGAAGNSWIREARPVKRLLLSAACVALLSGHHAKPLGAMGRALRELRNRVHANHLVGARAAQ